MHLRNQSRLSPDRARQPYALYRAAQVRELDRIAIEEYGIPGETLMERAGAAAFRVLRETWPGARDLTVLAGLGNNGGDGFVIARLAQEAGLNVRVLQLGDPDNASVATRAPTPRPSAPRVATGSPSMRLPERTDVIVDALLGTGLDRDVEGRWAEVIRAVNAPSCARDGRGHSLGAQRRHRGRHGRGGGADITVTFIALKQGLFTGEGPEVCGRLVFDALESAAASLRPRAARGAAHRLAQGVLACSGRGRARAHKGHFGHVLVVGGNPGYGGAARLAAEAAARGGRGAGEPGDASGARRGGGGRAARDHGPGSTLPLPGALLARATVVAIGPGLGRDDWAGSLWDEVMARLSRWWWTPTPSICWPARRSGVTTGC